MSSTERPTPSARGEYAVLGAALFSPIVVPVTVLLLLPVVASVAVVVAAAWLWLRVSATPREEVHT